MHHSSRGRGNARPSNTVLNNQQSIAQNRRNDNMFTQRNSPPPHNPNVNYQQQIPGLEKRRQ